MATPSDPRDHHRHARAGHALERLSEVMARLRGPGGCPWDHEQTLETLKTYLVEECYELVEAIDESVEAHCEELGDVLLQVVFQSEIRSEEACFGLADVIETVHNKLIRRHPHIFAEGHAQDSAAVLSTWETIKAQERKNAGKDAGRLAGVPKHAPALLRAYRIGQKAATTGFEWPSIDGARQKLNEELGELDEVLQNDAGLDDAPQRTRLREEFGDVLFALCNVARYLEIDPEHALRDAIAKFERRFRVIEEELDRVGETFEQSSLDRLESLWETAKEQEMTPTR